MCLCSASLAPAYASANKIGEGPSILREGHWLKVKGRLDEHGTLIADAAELKPAAVYEVLVGTVADGVHSWDRFVLLGVPVTVSERVAAEGLPARAPENLRLKVEGRYRGPRKFSAREIKSRGAGRDSVEGRIDSIEVADGGFRVRIMNTVAFLPDEIPLEHDLPVEQIALVARRDAPSPDDLRGRRATDEDDEIPETVFLTDTLAVGGQIEARTTLEDELDLDETALEDRNDYELSTRLRLRWIPSPDFQAVATYRHRERWRVDQKDGRHQASSGQLSETYAWWRNVWGSGLDVVVGRQDFDDPREWIYDQDLDALRLIWARPRLRAEISASRTLSNGSARDKDTTNFVAYVSNNDDEKHLAGYIVDRRDDSAADDSPIHFGLRALGKWIPENEIWGDVSTVRGFRGNVDLDGFAWDIGTTWSPDCLGPFDLTAGWAFARGDDPSTVGKNEEFVQTGFQDNNGKFGGVTSFRYYGEVLDPELSNLSILTLGIGARVAERTSLDLVWHAYRQDVAASSLRDTDLDPAPSGLSRELGTGLDLILGCRRWKNWDVEVSGGWFHPGAAFPGTDDAFLGKVQVRLKF